MEAGCDWGLGFGFVVQNTSLHVNVTTYMYYMYRTGSQEFVPPLAKEHLGLVCRMILPQVHLR